MATHTIVNSKLQAQTPQVWDKPSENTPSLSPGVINPSRSITQDDEAHLRDYTLAAQVISWDEGVFETSLQVTAADITNIAINGDTVWYQINLHRAIPLDIETFHAHRLRIQLHKAELEVAKKDCQQEQQPDGEAGDSVSCRLQPTQSALTEFEIGRQHGRADAEARQHPIYTKPKSDYAIGYLEEYHGNSTEQQPAPTQPVEWSVVYDPRWQCYQAWVKDRCIDHASTYQEAERLAQRYIALDKTIKRQNAAVMKAYAG